MTTPHLPDAVRHALETTRCPCGHDISSHSLTGCHAYRPPFIGQKRVCCAKTPADIVDDLVAAAREEGRQEVRQAVEAALPDCRLINGPDLTCLDVLGSTFASGAVWTVDLCCVVCRVRAALAAPTEDGAR